MKGLKEGEEDRRNEAVNGPILLLEGRVVPENVHDVAGHLGVHVLAHITT